VKGWKSQSELEKQWKNWWKSQLFKKN
jgi:hypothetical protein